MTKYSFDEEGVAFYFFIATLAGFYVIPATIRLLWPRRQLENDKEPVSNTPESQEKKKRLASRAAAKLSWQLPKLTILSVAWVIFAWSLYSAWQVKVNFKAYDPFEILGVPSSASDEEIKAKFRKLSRMHHPDKATPENRESAEQRFVEISKAYKALTDEVTRRNWEEYGNPDGVRTFALGVALPSWLVTSSNRAILLALYCLAFGIGLPILVRRWWSKSKIFTKDGHRHSTMSYFFKELKETTSLKKIVELIANASEFEIDIPQRPTDAKIIHSFVESLEGSVDSNGDHFERPKKLNSPAAFKAYVLLYAHFHRIEVNDTDLLSDQTYIVKKAAQLVLGILQIAVARQWLHPAMNCMTLSQYIVQGTWEKKSPLLQLPYITLDIAKHATSGKRSIYSICELLDMNEEDRQSFLRSLSKEEISESLQIAQTFPEIHVDAVHFRILGQQHITPGGLITCQVRLSLSYPKLGKFTDVDDKGKAILNNEPAKKIEEDVETFEFDEDGNLIDEPGKKAISLLGESSRPIYCPRFPAVKRPSWWVMLVNKNNTNIVAPPVKVTDLIDFKTVALQFPSPPKPIPQVTLLLVIKSDSIVGGDIVKEVKFSVIPATEKAPTERWEISGDEDDQTVPFSEEDESE